MHRTNPIARDVGTGVGICVALLVSCWGQALGSPPEELQPPAHWRSVPTDLRVTGGSRIREVHYPPGKPPRFLRRDNKKIVRPAARRAHLALPPERLAARTDDASPTVDAWIIDTPPLDGLVSSIAVVATDERLGDLELDAVPSTTVGGYLLNPDPLESNYAVGLYDTGASAHVMGYGAATELGIIGADLLTSSIVTITGVTGSVDASVSWPLGVYVDGLQAIDPDTLLLDTAGMVGQYNVSIAVGPPPEPEQPDLPTPLGSPLSVYYAAAFDNGQAVTRTHGGETYTAPRIDVYPLGDPLIPTYPNSVPLELRPTDAAAVQYIPCLDYYGCPDGFDAPSTPSIIVGSFSTQSLFFVSSVDLYYGPHSAIDKDQFMIDTGAQVSVVGNRVASELSLDPANPDFLVPIQGVDGQTTMAPGFTISGIDIPALGEWLRFLQVPVVLLDVASPEGGTLDGIIGMNLMTNLNFVLHGGGLAGQPAPSLEYEVIVPATVDVDFDSDGDVDMDDFSHFQACLTGPEAIQSDTACQNALLDADSDVDDDDRGLFLNCLSGADIPAAPACTTP